jgi:hypothetical protein
MYEIANPDSLLKRPSDSGGTGVRPGTPGNVKDELFAEPVIVFRPIEHHPHHESLSSAWSSLQASDSLTRWLWHASKTASVPGLGPARGAQL